MPTLRALSREAWVIALTLLRLGLGVGLCVAIWQHDSPYISVAWLSAIVVCDIGDGVVARWFGVDTTTRRIVDVAVDRFSIHSAMAVMMLTIPGAFWLVLPVVVRDVVLILANGLLLARKWSIITSGMIHRTGTFLYAVLGGVVLFTRGEVADWVAIIVSVTVWFLLLDYLRAGILVPVQARGEPLARYQACGLKALRGIMPPRRNTIGI